METTIENPNKPHNGRTMAGVLLLLIGGILLVNQLDWFFIPHWLFSWPMWLIGYGLYMGGKYNFRKTVWAVLVVIGTAFLVTENIENAGRVIWPMGIIAAGIWMATKHNNNRQVNNVRPGE